MQRIPGTGTPAVSDPTPVAVASRSFSRHPVLRGELLAMGEELNGQIDVLVEAADGLATEIADLNVRIVVPAKD